MKKNIAYIIFGIVIFVCFAITLICIPFLLFLGGIEALGSFADPGSSGYFMSMLSKNGIAFLVFGVLMIPAVILFVKGVHGSAKKIVDDANPVPEKEKLNETEMAEYKKNRKNTILLTLAILAAIIIRVVLFFM